MMQTIARFETFHEAIECAKKQFPSTPVRTTRWQGVDVSAKPEMQMHEVLNFSFQVDIESGRSIGEDKLNYLQRDIKPNLPWADDHFEERVCGEPLNPGKTWETWPYNKSADTFRNKDGQFNHNYMERYWPRYAGYTDDGILPQMNGLAADALNRFGIRHRYGDLNDLVAVLLEDPNTRQAYLPVWFPEDGSHRDRKPCTLGYHFINRNNKLSITYYIRSCDFIRHFRDDIYLTVRLLIWVLERLQRADQNWEQVGLGDFTMHIVSLHCFRNDYLMLNTGDKK